MVFDLEVTDVRGGFTDDIFRKVSRLTSLQNTQNLK
jgi:hypothetical protein